MLDEQLIWFRIECLAASDDADDIKDAIVEYFADVEHLSDQTIDRFYNLYLDYQREADYMEGLFRTVMPQVGIYFL